MNHHFFQLRSFITYWLNAVDAHSLHSPFFYDFYTNVIRPRKGVAYIPPFDQIEQERRSLLSNNTTIGIVDLGAGSKHISGSQRQISEIARHSLSTAKYSCIYYRALAHYDAHFVLELGTSLGINTMYLASHRRANITTIEGSPSIAQLASALFEKHDLKNIQLNCGNLDNILPEIVQGLPRIDFAFLDANHRRDPTLNYFNTIAARVHRKSIIVLDDIHSNAEMNDAWTAVKNHPSVKGTADLFRCGFVFFEPSLNSQHFVLQI